LGLKCGSFSISFSLSFLSQLSSGSLLGLNLRPALFGGSLASFFCRLSLGLCGQLPLLCSGSPSLSSIICTRRWWGNRRRSLFPRPKQIDGIAPLCLSRTGSWNGCFRSRGRSSSTESKERNGRPRLRLLGAFVRLGSRTLRLYCCGGCLPLRSGPCLLLLPCLSLGRSFLPLRFGSCLPLRSGPCLP